MEPIWNDGRRFAGRVALVTGAGGTLGGAVATGFGREGAAVVLGYRSSQSAAEAVAAQIVSAGGAAYADRLDVTDQDSVDGFVARADETYGRVDVLVNAAGRLDQADTVRFEAMTPEAATELLMVDVVGTGRSAGSPRRSRETSHRRFASTRSRLVRSQGIGSRSGVSPRNTSKRRRR
jgi:NAD(P)-dependent dehydrogenase (short-subunit alcohol dehydrogenase family)